MIPEHYITGLRFEKSPHKYFFEGHEFQGITSLLNRYIFPDKYRGVSTVILEDAAQRGSAVHDAIERYYEDLRNGQEHLFLSPVVQRFNDMIRPTMLKVVDNEVLVTDYVSRATAIDVVFKDVEGGVILGDIKTTCEYDELYLRWQLSVNALLYEMCFGVPVVGLVGIWMPFRGEGGVREVERLPDEEVERLLTAGLENDETFETVYKPMVEEAMPEELASIAERIATLKRRMANDKEELATLESEVSQQFGRSSAKSWRGCGIVISRVNGTTRTTFDSKRFLEDHKELADLAGEYYKTTTTADTIRIKFE